MWQHIFSFNLFDLLMYMTRLRINSKIMDMILNSAEDFHLTPFGYYIHAYDSLVGLKIQIQKYMKLNSNSFESITPQPIDQVK